MAFDQEKNTAQQIVGKWDSLKCRLSRGEYRYIYTVVINKLWWAFGVLLSPVLIIFFYTLRPMIWVKIGRLTANRIGHLAYNTDLFLRRLQLGAYPAKARYYFVSSKKDICNRQLLTMFRRVLRICENDFLDSIFTGIQPLLEKTPFYQPLVMNSNECYEFEHAGPSLAFTDEEVTLGVEKLKEMGVIYGKDPILCIAARDSAYLEEKYSSLGKVDLSYHDYRDCDIDDFIPAVEYMLSKGWFVIRMGSVVKKPISYEHPRLIDYSVSDYRSEFMDIFLAANCDIFLCNTASISTIATIFDVPRVGVNWVPFGLPPMGKKTLYIPKKLKDTHAGKSVTFPEAFKMGVAFEADGKQLKSLGLEYQDNSSHDIYCVTQEMLERTEGTFNETEKEKSLRLMYYETFCPKIWKDVPTSNLGKEWLKENGPLYFDE